MSAERQHIGDDVGADKVGRDKAGRDVINQTFQHMTPEERAIRRVEEKLDDLTDRVIAQDKRIDELEALLVEANKLTMRLYGTVAMDTDRNIKYTRLALGLIIVIELLARLWPVRAAFAAFLF